MNQPFPSSFKRFLEAFAQDYQRLRSSRGRGQRAASGQRAEDEFAGHAAYVEGDDLRRVDWNAFGRSEKLFLKIFQAESQRELTLLLDDSRSMMAGQVEGEKQTFALQLTALLGAIALRNKARLTLVVNDQTQSFHDAKAIAALLEALERVDFSQKTSFLAGRSKLFAKLLGESKNVMIISDFLEGDEARRGLQDLRKSRRKITCLATLAGDEIDPNAGRLSGNLELEGLESRAKLRLQNDPKLISRYRHHLLEHLSKWQDETARVGGTWMALNASIGVPECARNQLFSADGVWL